MVWSISPCEEAVADVAVWGEDLQDLVEEVVEEVVEEEVT